MKRIIIIVVFLAAGFFAWQQYHARQARLRAAAEARQRAAEAERQRLAEEDRRKAEEARRREEDRRKAEEAAKAAEEAKRKEEMERLRLEREAARKAEEAERAREAAKAAAEKFITDNVAHFAEAKAAFAEQAAKSERFGGKGLTAAFRLFVPGERGPRFLAVAFEKGKVVRSEELAHGADPTPISLKELKRLLGSVPWVSRREGSETAVYHGFSGTGDALRLDDFMLLKPSLAFAVEMDLKPYGKLALGTLGFAEELAPDDLKDRVRAAIEAQLKDNLRRRDKNRRVVFYNGHEVRHRGNLHEVPRRFLRDNLKDIRAARAGKHTDWKLARETRRRQRAEWLALYEEAEMREKGIEIPLEIVVPEADVTRAVQATKFRLSPAPPAKAGKGK